MRAYDNSSGVNRKELGAIGEEAAVKLLLRSGYKIRHRNFRCPFGELDLVAEERGTLVFIEVKTRTTSKFGGPLEAVSPAKQRRLVRLATYYLKGRRMLDRPCRFDAVSVVVTPAGRDQSIELIRNAFVPDK
ncbi:MAG: YraN family protein [Armatimonadetes bacterium]|nr:YraN family protein [Armatimonadota bacterium]MBI2200654.1 YraN family protein [Armatimonadota bacterium]MBI2247464.1 YraN family protein [Armatimonadota bacterium]MBI2973033.1 YraN family protein [Armatimonadota bacterium]